MPSDDYYYCLHPRIVEVKQRQIHLSGVLRFLCYYANMVTFLIKILFFLFVWSTLWDTPYIYGDDSFSTTDLNSWLHSPPSVLNTSASRFFYQYEKLLPEISSVFREGELAVSNASKNRGFLANYPSSWDIARNAFSVLNSSSMPRFLSEAFRLLQFDDLSSIDSNNNDASSNFPEIAVSKHLGQCKDSALVQSSGTKCSLLARNFGGRLGCQKSLSSLLTGSKKLPPGIPSNARVADACPQSCGLCRQCAANCAYWFIGNSLCDLQCNNPACQFDGGDCWSVDCVVSSWSAWSACSVSCNGPGVQTRTRSVNSPPSQGGKSCPSLLENQSGCNTGVACPADCLVSEWKNWSACSSTCGNGIEKRERVVTKFPDVNGLPCPSLKQNRGCYLTGCVAGCIVSEWQEWSTCTASCAGGQQYRRRTIKNYPIGGGSKCPSIEETQACNTFSCASDCNVSVWKEWTACTAECNGGTKSRQRSILNGENTLTCPPLLQQATCNSNPCPVDCQLNTWGEWQLCSATCGIGTQIRKRSILQSSVGLGRKCSSLQTQRSCFDNPCPIDCAVSLWSAWSTCSASCGHGLITRLRKVTTFPANGGAICPELLQSQDCSSACTLNCVLSDWTNWNSCELHCSGIRGASSNSQRTRTVLLDSASCPDLSSLIQTQKCANECNRNCDVSVWQEWTACSSSCGGGQRSRQRTITTSPSGNGKVCPSLTSTEACAIADCPLEGQTVNCSLSDWSDWGNCDVSCGGGRQASKRLILAYPSSGGTSCATTVRFKEGCNSISCVIDCTVTGWSAWSSCTATCGSGSQRRTRSIIKNKNEFGRTCPPLSENQVCGSYPCPTDCVVSTWNNWSSCNGACGEATRTRTRSVITPPSLDPLGAACGPTRQTSVCVGAQGMCGSDCRVSEWSTWSQCEVNCGGGFSFRSRAIISQPIKGGALCPQGLQDVKECNTHACAMDCAVSLWSTWSACSLSCSVAGEAGVRVRTRAISTLARNGGAKCPILQEEDRNCNFDVPCSLPCAYTDWSTFSACSATCGVGKSTRQRSLISSQVFQLNQCTNTVDSIDCLSSVPCVVDCVMAEWENWNACSATCGGGTRQRSRAIQIFPSNGGARCPPLNEFNPCNTESCDGTPCKVSEWQQWDSCSKFCGGGVQSRKRNVLVPAFGKGDPCPSLTKQRGCNLQRCANTACADNTELVQQTGFTCSILAAQGCNRRLKALSVENKVTFPAGVPPEVRVLDACPVTCDACKECAPGCQIRDMGQSVCDEACNVTACQNDLGDCGGDCSLKFSVVGGVTLKPDVMNLVASQTINVSCKDKFNGFGRFDSLPSISSFNLTCDGAGLYSIQPSTVGLSLLSGNSSTPFSTFPTCVEDACPYIITSGFSAPYAQLNGYYRRSSADVAGRSLYVLDIANMPALHLLNTSNITKDTNSSFELTYLWVFPLVDLQTNSFGWRITIDNPLTGTISNKNIAAIGSGANCLIPLVGHNESVACPTHWTVGTTSSTLQSTDIRLQCLTRPLFDSQLVEANTLLAAASPSGEGVAIPKTVRFGESVSCMDFKDVEKLTNRTCSNLKELLKCSFRLVDTGTVLPSYISKTDTVSSICPFTCGQCQLCAPACPRWYTGNGYCDATCNVASCQFDGGDCANGTLRDISTTATTTTNPLSCTDNSLVTELGYTCPLLQSVAISAKLDNCTTLLSAISSAGKPLPAAIPPEVRILDACPATCAACNDSTRLMTIPFVCEDTTLLAADGHSLTCTMLSEAAVNASACTFSPASLDFRVSPTYAASRLPVIAVTASPLPSAALYQALPAGSLTLNSPLREFCPVLCSVCTPSSTPESTCRDNPLVEKQGFSCALLVNATTEGCNALLSNLGSGKVPKDLPSGVRVRDTCLKTCNACDRNTSSPSATSTTLIGTPTCKDDPIVLEMGYKCDVFLQFAKEGCSSTLRDLLGSSFIPRKNLTNATRISDVCKKTCNLCAPVVTSSNCKDSDLVTSLGYSCSILISVGQQGCNSLISDLTTALPANIPSSTKVKDACKKSCGLCQKVATCNDGFQNGDEIGIDCGGSCRPCAACTTKPLKNLGKGYIIEGNGITHLSTRSIRCAKGYERKTGNLEPQIIVCLDGTFEKILLQCQEMMISLQLATLTMFNASDLDYTAVSSIHTALVNSLSIVFPDILKILTVSKQQQQSSTADTKCVDQSATKDLPYSCSAMANFCDTKLSVLAATQGVSLPKSISVDTLVKEICLVTCNECDPTKSTTLVVKAKGDSPLYVDFAILWNHPTLSIQTRFTNDLPHIFINQIAVQFITRDIQLISPSDTLLWNAPLLSTTKASTALRSRPITVAFSLPQNKSITKTVWDTAFTTDSTVAVAKRVVKSSGFPFPTAQNISFLPPLDSNLIGFSSSVIPSTKNIDASYLSSFHPVRIDYPSSNLPIKHLNGLSSPILSSLQGVCASTTSISSASANPNSCCALHKTLHAFLEGPCGTLLYDKSLSSDRLTFFCETDFQNNNAHFSMFSSISSFTTITCLSLIRKELRNYEHRGGSACEMNIFVRELVNSWCARSAQGKYCFLSVEDVLSKVTLKYLTSASSSELDKWCATDSCLRQNTKYFDALTQLQLAWAILFKNPPNAQINRRLNTEKINEETHFSPFPFVSSFSKGHEGLSRHIVLHQQHNIKVSKELQSLVQTTLKYVKGSPPLDEQSFFSSQNNFSSSSQRRLATSKKLKQPLAESGEEILNLACMRVEGDYCQQTLQLLSTTSPIIDPFLVVQPCISRCFVPITGATGIIIEKQGIYEKNPYDEVLGAFMRGYGRYYCIKNNNGKYCGDLLYNRIKKSQ
ncbi:sushi domain (scr repeat) domain-containing protein, partial [Cardiosporidium cionae]